MLSIKKKIKNINCLVNLGSSKQNLLVGGKPINVNTEINKK